MIDLLESIITIKLVTAADVIFLFICDRILENLPSTHKRQAK